jgi:putative phage-type endonuclease
MSTIATPKIGLSDEAIEERRKAIGASDVAAILGISPYTTGWTIWAEKLGLLTRWHGNQATMLGHHFERTVLHVASVRLGCALRTNIRRQCHGRPITATLDAQTELGIPVEAKTAGLTGPVTGHWGPPDTDQIPEHYLLQVHTQLLCCDEAPYAYLFALIANRGVVRYIVERSETLCDVLVTQLTAWWDKHVIGGVEPDHTGVAYEAVKRLIRVPKKVIILPSFAGGLVDAYQHETETAKAHKAKATELRSKIALVLKDDTGYAEEGLLEDGRSVTFYETHTKTKSYRVLRVKQPRRRKRR